MAHTYKPKAIFKMKCTLPATVKKQGKFYIAKCELFDVCSQGTSPDKALNNLKEAMSLFFITCFEMGTLEKILKDCGFKRAETKNIMELPKDELFIDIPIPLYKETPVLCHV